MPLQNITRKHVALLEYPRIVAAGTWSIQSLEIIPSTEARCTIRYFSNSEKAGQFESLERTPSSPMYLYAKCQPSMFSTNRYTVVDPNLSGHFSHFGISIFFALAIAFSIIG